MQNKHILFLLIFGILMVSCDSFVNEQETLTRRELPDNGTFTALLNGEPWEGRPRAGFVITTEGDTLLQVFSIRYDSLLYPFNDGIHFTVNYSELIHDYSVISQPEIGKTYYALSFFGELSGDVSFANYFPVEHPGNHFNVEVGYDSLGVQRARGTFAMKIVVQSGLSYEANQLRQQPDTVYITNGTFDVIMETEIVDNRPIE